MSHLCIIWLRRVEGLLQYRDRVKRLFGHSHLECRAGTQKLKQIPAEPSIG